MHLQSPSLHIHVSVTRDEADFLGVFANARDLGGIFMPVPPMSDKSSNDALEIVLSG